MNNDKHFDLFIEVNLALNYSFIDKCIAFVTGCLKLLKMKAL